MYIIESLLWRAGLPAILTVICLPLISAVFAVAVTWGSALTVFIIWAVIINGGFLIFDGDDDLNWFD